MDAVLTAVREAALATLTFYMGLAHYLLNGAYVPSATQPMSLPLLRLQQDARARVYIFSLALIFRMWSQPHYRNRTFKEDMIKNLRNVAIPGTGVPLSLFCYSKLSALFLICGILPVVCFVAAVYKALLQWAPELQGQCNVTTVYRELRRNPVQRLVTITLRLYVEHLLHPPDWFSFWTLNCRLASFHSLTTGAQGYRYEDKWTFLVEGEAAGVPVSPYLKTPSLVIKDTNEEGGMGIFFYKNAVCGGQWIIQERLHNAEAIRALLPDDAPLSTVRVITTSAWSLHHDAHDSTSGHKAEDFVIPVSCVFRAGRKGASTDHSSVLFDVDKRTGRILRGTSNAHWYQLGILKASKCPWLSSHDMTHHPDDPELELTGKFLPDVPGMLSMVVDSHFKLLPDVTIVGWDVAYTTTGICFLEVNLSCNFFRGTFDVPAYFEFVDGYFAKLSGLRRTPNSAHED